MTASLTIHSSERDFGQIFARLAMQLRWMDADAQAIRSYHQALGDLPLDIVSQSASNLANERGRKFFPTTGEWRDAAQLLLDARQRQEFTQPRDWKVECDACDDSGWERLECTGAGGGCGRERPHSPHTYAVICPCRQTNRTFQRHQWSEQRRTA